MKDKETAGATHPVWCSREHCTVPQELPDYETGSWGEHRSVPVMNAWGDASACLTQPLCPWETSVFLKVRPEDQVGKTGALNIPISIPLELGSPLLLALKQEITTQEARFPSLADVARRAQRNADAAVVDAANYFEGKAA